jgi:hypothetical protein
MEEKHDILIFPANDYHLGCICKRHSMSEPVIWRDIPIGNIIINNNPDAFSKEDFSPYCIYVLSDENEHEVEKPMIEVEGIHKGEIQYRKKPPISGVWKTIIGTDNPELIDKGVVPISKSTIRIYKTSNNLGKPFDKVMVEYYIKHNGRLNADSEVLPKLNQDGTLAVSLVEDGIPTMRDVEAESFKRYPADGNMSNWKERKAFVEGAKWIKESL